MQPLQVVISYRYLSEVLLYLQATTRAMMVNFILIVVVLCLVCSVRLLGFDENHSWARYRFIHLGLDKRKVQIGNGEEVTAMVPCPTSEIFHQAHCRVMGRVGQTLIHKRKLLSSSQNSKKQSMGMLIAEGYVGLDRLIATSP